MGECEHVWGLSVYFPYVVCRKCPKTMAVKEAEARLNEEWMMKLSERMQKMKDYKEVLHDGNVDPVIGEWVQEVAQLEEKNEELETRLMSENEHELSDDIRAVGAGAKDRRLALSLADRVRVLENEHAALKREAKAWLDCAVYDEDSHAWAVFEKNDEYHTLYTLLTAEEPE